jgi:hypothetical protein
MDLIDSLFGMGGGYVLDFSNRTFAEFFDTELRVNIYDPRYDREGDSKAKRLRYFLKTSSPELRLKTLLALWEYRETKRRRSGLPEHIPNAQQEFQALVNRLGGPPSPRTTSPTPHAVRRLDPTLSRKLKQNLFKLEELPAQQRGFAYERFLKDLFDTNGLAARASFRLIGEQIDGSFQLGAETYLLEAKWTGPPVGVADLRSFNGKVEDKAAWSRGLFVSHSGFSEDGLTAFGRGKRVVCMDGLDLYEMLDRALPLADVVARKVRRAAESGDPFVRVRDLYP